MIRIALCDDDRAQLEALSLLVKGYALNRTIRLTAFTSAAEHLDAIRDEGSFDLYLLDVVMPELNGIQLGKKLRQMDDQGLIIYLTTSSEFAVESYQVRAYYYLLKPVERSELFPTLDRAIEQLNAQRNEFVLVRGRDSIHRIMLDDVLYAETYNRAVRYHLCDGQAIVSTSIHEPFHQAVKSLLEKQHFVPCGASFVINLKNVSTMESTCAVFKNGERLFLSKQASNALRTIWMDYWLGEKRIWSH